MRINLIDLNDLTHDELARECARDEREEIRALGHDLREAVDAEEDSDSIVEQIRAALTA